VSSQKKGKEKRSRKQGKKQRKRTEEEIRGDQRVSTKKPTNRNTRTEGKRLKGRERGEYSPADARIDTFVFVFIFAR
jgi:hypothetical protein